MASLVHPDQPDSSISEIIPSEYTLHGLYLGNYRAACNEVLIKKYNIGAILTVGTQLQSPRYPNVYNLKISVQDNPLNNLHYYFPKCLNFITDNIRVTNVLVHCKAGVSRSATIVIAYLMKTKKYSLKKALKKTKDLRPIVNPNSGFMMQLQMYQKQLLGEKAKKQSLQKEDPKTMKRFYSSRKTVPINFGIKQSPKNINKQISLKKTDTQTLKLTNSKPKISNKPTRKKLPIFAIFN